MFTWSGVLLFLYLHQELEAAIPIQIVTEKTDAETLKQEFPYILSMIPAKEPLITQAVARKQSTDEKNPDMLNLQEKNSGDLIALFEQNTTKDYKDHKIHLSAAETLNKDKKIVVLPEKVETEITPEKVLEESKTSVNSNDLREVSKENKTLVEIASEETIYQQGTLTKKPPSQRQKRSLLENQDLLKPLNAAQTPISNQVVDLSNSLEGEEISKEDLLRYGKGKWNNKYGFYHYDSGYVDYNVPFPYYRRPWSKPVSVGHGTQIAAAQLFPILKSFLLGGSSLKGARHKYGNRPAWKKPW